MAILEVNGYATPAPTQYDVKLADVQSASSGRNDNGIMSMEVVRKDVASIDVAWTNLTQKQLEDITKNSPAGKIKVRFFYGGWKTATMYRGDRDVSLKFLDDDGESYWDLSLGLVEY